MHMCVIHYNLNLCNRPIDERFAYIDNYSRYMASNYGLIYDTLNNRLVSQFKYKYDNKNKYYYRVNVIDDYGKKHCARVNRLILMAFDPRDEYENLESNHIDLNTENNCLYNLEWVSHLQNVQHYCKSINSEIIYTDYIVNKICIGLEKQMSYDDIAIKLLQQKPTKKLRGYITAIRRGLIRKDISSKYNIPDKQDNRSYFTDDQIHFICKCIVNGMNSAKILDELGIQLQIGSKERRRVLEIIRRIRSKERFTRISNLYY